MAKHYPVFTLNNPSFFSYDPTLVQINIVETVNR